MAVSVAHGGGPLVCRHCNQPCPGYDKRVRRWCHLDTCPLKTVLVADVPRVQCPAHGVVTIRVPWAEPGSGFTALFEALVINWLKAASISAVADRLRLSWNAVDGLLQRAVKRGLSRRAALAPRKLSVDETAYRKGHDYITVATDQGQGVVLHVAENRDALADADHRIAFDRFHVAQYLGKAVDQVRRQEHRRWLGQGDERLKGSKYQWLRNRSTMDWHPQRGFTALRKSSLKTARA